MHTQQQNVGVISAWRERTREHIYDGLADSSHSAPRNAVISVMRETLATKIKGAKRYRHYHCLAQSKKADRTAEEFLELANEAEEHAKRLAIRILELGGEPGSGGVEDEIPPAETMTLVEMMRENFQLQCIVVDGYREIVQFLSNVDFTTRGIFEDILRTEERHAAEFADLLAGLLPGLEENGTPHRRTFARAETALYYPEGFR